MIPIAHSHKNSRARVVGRGLNMYWYLKYREILEDLTSFWVTLSGNKPTIVCIYTGPALEWVTSPVLSLTGEVGNYMGLLGDAAFRDCVKGGLLASRECAITRAWRSNKVQKSGPKSGRKSYPQYDGASYGYGEDGGGWGVGVLKVGVGAFEWSKEFPHSLLRCGLLEMRDNRCLSLDDIYLLVPIWFHAINVGPRIEGLTNFIIRIPFLLIYDFYKGYFR